MTISIEQKIISLQADLKPGALKSSMIEGVKGVVKDGWPQVKGFATVELKLLAQSMTEIQSLAVKRTYIAARNSA